jgi:predicted ATPase
MVVEEPEAHVHPKGQMGLARFMAMLARLGVNVMVTTHSDLITLKLAQMVGLQAYLLKRGKGSATVETSI